MCPVNGENIMELLPPKFVATGRNSSATLRDSADMAEEYAPRTETGILDLPDEVLRQIILLLTPSERLPLGDSCQRSKTLIFEERELLRHLDFSKNAHLTTMTHIQRYFNNEDARQYVRRVNARNVECIEAGDPLNNSIGRAINLVEVNIHGTKFEDIYQLGTFLEPLRHLRKLSIDWPRTTGDNASRCRRILKQPFNKLTYLSVGFRETSLTTMFTSYLPLCQQLEELYIESPTFCWDSRWVESWNSEIKLKNLKIVRFRGTFYLIHNITAILPDPERWTHFQLCDNTDFSPKGDFYIEKDFEVCEELLRSKSLEEFLDNAPWGNFKLKWALDPSCLLKEVLRMTHKDVPEDFCCLPTFPTREPYLLKAEEAGMLLKDPRYQISYLRLKHRLERDCDAHLLASAYPNLTELVLHSVTSHQRKSPKKPHFQRHLRRRCSPPPEKQDDSPNLDSSFKLLVKNTPNLRHFTLGDPGGGRAEDWDLDALYLISGWKNLATLRISTVPCEDSQFLIEIGKKCKNLQNLSLSDFYYHQSEGAAIDKVALFEMLKYCRNLRNFTIVRYNIDQADMFASLAENVELERVEAMNVNPHHSAAPWISSLEKMTRRCTKLTTIDCYITFKTQDDRNEAKSAVERIKKECRRPNFQLDVEFAA